MPVTTIYRVFYCWNIFQAYWNKFTRGLAEESKLPADKVNNYLTVSRVTAPRFNATHACGTFYL